jgi:hypothetical protein
MVEDTVEKRDSWQIVINARISRRRIAINSPIF